MIGRQETCPSLVMMRSVSRGSDKVREKRSRSRSETSSEERIRDLKMELDSRRAIRTSLLRRQIAWALSRSSERSPAGLLSEDSRSEVVSRGLEEISSSSLPKTRSAIGRMPEGSVLLRAAALVGGRLEEEGDGVERWISGRVHRSARADRAWIVESRVTRRVLGALIDRRGVERFGERAGLAKGQVGERGDDWIFLSLDRITGVPPRDRALVSRSTRKLYRVGRSTDLSLGSGSPGDALRRGLGWIR